MENLPFCDPTRMYWWSGVKDSERMGPLPIGTSCTCWWGEGWMCKCRVEFGFGVRLGSGKECTKKIWIGPLPIGSSCTCGGRRGGCAGESVNVGLSLGLG